MKHLQGADDDAMSFYIKGVLEMEKTHRKEAKEYFKKTLAMMDQDNPEVMRCYGLCEYRLGNREQGLSQIMKAYEMNSMDAEIILNLVEITILEEQWDAADTYIAHYITHSEELQFFDRKKVYYDEKIRIFEAYVASQTT